ncbi:MAG: hypothetical protein AAB408_05150, partial [Patescibacteria group bacterium]
DMAVPHHHDLQTLAAVGVVSQELVAKNEGTAACELCPDTLEIECGLFSLWDVVVHTLREKTANKAGVAVLHHITEDESSVQPLLLEEVGAEVDELVVVVHTCEPNVLDRGHHLLGQSSRSATELYHFELPVNVFLLPLNGRDDSFIGFLDVPMLLRHERSIGFWIDDG